MKISGLVSVIVPLHNGAPGIQRCLQAIAAQRYRPIEIIVVDDGSGDPSLGWVRAFRANQGEAAVPVHVIEQPQSGIGAALAAGLATARGEFIAFAHQADLWHPEKLAWQISALQCQPDAGLSLAALEESRAGARQYLASPPLRGRVPIGTVPLSSLVARRDAIAAAGGIDADPALAPLHHLCTRLALAGHAVRELRAVARCERPAVSPLPVMQLAASIDKLARQGALSPRQAGWSRGRLLALSGWQALLADDPVIARARFRDALSACPWRPEIWLGLGFAHVDGWLFALGLLSRRSPLATGR